MTSQERHKGGDCNMIMENPKADPPVRTSLFVSILLAIIGVLLVGFAGVVYSQIQSDRQALSTSVKEQAVKMATLEIKTAQSSVAFEYIQRSLDDIKKTADKTATDVEQLKQKVERGK